MPRGKAAAWEWPQQGAEHVEESSARAAGWQMLGRASEAVPPAAAHDLLTLLQDITCYSRTAITLERKEVSTPLQKQGQWWHLLAVRCTGHAAHRPSRRHEALVTRCLHSSTLLPCSALSCPRSAVFEPGTPAKLRGQCRNVPRHGQSQQLATKLDTATVITPTAGLTRT